ncbi:MAG TPA: DinB family protein [Terriglobales bacterium]|nr:DinB family protein [Terriglobales bacterium]
MNTECKAIADQLRRALGGEAWHGPSLREIMSGISAGQAGKRPIAGAHSIWELLLHIETWMAEPLATLTRGVPMRDLVGLAVEVDWPPVGAETEDRWKAAQERAFSTGEKLARAIEGFGDERLGETVPGRDHAYYILLHGVVQHTLYHGGQIALLKRALA